MELGYQNPSTRSVREKERALTSANNIKESKFGGAILNCRKSARQLGREMGRLDKEFKRKQMHIDQEKKRFLQQLNIPEPMMILERPASTGTLQRRYRNQESPDENKPGYMKPIKWRVKTASTLSTIDVFHVNVRKKLNVWDMAMLEVDKPHFQAKVVPSVPLSVDEENKLSSRRTNELNERPWSSSGKARLLGRADNSVLKVNKEKSKTKMSSPSPASPVTTTKSRESPPTANNETDEVKENKEDRSDHDKVFVTALPVIREKTEEDITTEKINKNVTFAEKVETFSLPVEDENPEEGAEVAQTKAQNSGKNKPTPTPYRRATTPKKTTNKIKTTSSPAHDTKYRKETKAKKMSKS